MTREYATRALQNAESSRNEARARMSAAREGSRKWAEAEEDLSFWQGKVANMQVALNTIAR